MDEHEQIEDVEGHRLASNDNETVVRRPVMPAEMVEDDDVEGHRLATNDNEILLGPAPRPAPDRPAG